jgi:hypothetical protein
VQPPTKKANRAPLQNGTRCLLISWEKAPGKSTRAGPQHPDLGAYGKQGRRTGSEPGIHNPKAAHDKDHRHREARGAERGDLIEEAGLYRREPIACDPRDAHHFHLNLGTTGACLMSNLGWDD